MGRTSAIGEDFYFFSGCLIVQRVSILALTAKAAIATFWLAHEILCQRSWLVAPSCPPRRRDCFAGYTQRQNPRRSSKCRAPQPVRKSHTKRKSTSTFVSLWGEARKGRPLLSQNHSKKERTKGPPNLVKSLVCKTTGATSNAG